MYDTRKIVYGTVISCGNHNDLTIKLENGETGIVPANEIGRREASQLATYHWMVGRSLGFCEGELNDAGLRMLSGKAFENLLYNRIVSDFQGKKRNVYSAHYSSKTKDGRLAFYTLAQGVNASIITADLSCTRIASFNEISLPEELTVAVKEIDSQGRIRVSSKLAFGDFAMNVQRLGISVGSIVEGYASGFVPSNGDAIITLAPNLAVLVNSRAAAGNWVKVQITRVDDENQRLSGQIIEDCGRTCKDFFFDRWMLDATAFPAYVDVDEFDSRVRPRARKNENSPVSLPKDEDIQISYEMTASVSPFVTREGEVGIRAPLNGGTVKSIVFESQHGYLNERHMLAAKAVNDLKYTTAWQVQRYLHLKHGVKISEKQLWTILSRLVKLDIVHKLRFSWDGKSSTTNILYPGATLYQAYTGSPRYLPSWAYSAEPDVAQIKCCLSANQLLLGMMHGSQSIAAIEPRVYIMTESGLRIRPRHKLVTGEGDVIYLESARNNWLEEMLDKLKRYDVCRQECNERFSVYLTLEDASVIPAVAQHIADLQLGFDVFVTCDLHCLPEPRCKKVPAFDQGKKKQENKSGLFARFKNHFGR